MWGSCSSSSSSVVCVNAQERDLLVRLPRPLQLKGPKLYQPRASQRDQRNKKVRREDSAQALLSKAVCQIMNNVGIVSLMAKDKDIVTNLTKDYLIQLGVRLKSAREHGKGGFGDSMERALTEVNVGSVLELARNWRHDADEWAKHSGNGREDCLPIYIVDENEEDVVPEIHFPSSEESLDHATPQMETGLQMLQSLEQGSLGNKENTRDFES